MSLKDILVISGQSGLFKYVSQGRATIIVENMTDHKRTGIPSTAKISMLEDIAVFTTKEELPLRDVFKKIQEQEKGGPALSHKSPDAELKRYFETVLDYDKEKVYLSDIRKVLMWYNALLDLGITCFEKEPDAAPDTDIAAPDTDIAPPDTQQA
ncbi:MAG: DUF5606 domain-containing protein [Bacteroidales bacterium]|nr:DUF5606 domain-containing protein [Bacteroidales bacterium]